MNANEFNANAASENNVATSAGVNSNNALSTLNDKGELSSEWASSTLEALVPVAAKDHPSNLPTVNTERPAFVTQGSSTYTNAPPPTPGSVSQLFPGAFPPSRNPSTGPLPNEQHGKNFATMVADQDVQYMKEVTTSALETMRDYATKTGEAVGGYLPESVAAYLPVSTGNSQAVHTNGTASYPQENSDLATGNGTKDHAVSVSNSQPYNEDATSTSTNSSTKENLQHAPSTDDARTETMREGLGSVKEENHVPENPESPSNDKPDNENTDRSTSLPIGANRDESRAREGQEEGGADTDASTRSLVGTQTDRSLYTPGTSLFSGKWQDDGQSAVSSTARENDQDEKSAGERVPVSSNTSGGPSHDSPNPAVNRVIDALPAAKESSGSANANAPTAQNEDTEPKSQSHSQAQPVHRQAPVTHAREHPLASHEETHIGTAPGGQITTGVPPASASSQRLNSGDSKPGSGSTGWERVDSSRATPGHGPPPVPRKDDEGADVRARKTSAHAAAVGAVAASAAAGAGAGGDVAGMGAGNAAPVAPGANTQPAHAHAHAHGAPPNGDEEHSNGNEGKKSGFFEKLKREVRALGGKHHKEDSAKKHALKN